MIPEVVKPLGAAVASTLFGVGTWIVAQASVLDEPLDLIGGSVLLVSAVIALRMILRAARYERESASATEERLARTIVALEDDLSDERRRSARLLVAYDRERQLRLSLEAYGVRERRISPAEARQLVQPKDYSDLQDEVDELGENLEVNPEDL